MSLVHGELLGHPERLPGGKDGHLRHRIRMLGEHRDQRMAGLVDRHRSLLLRQQCVRGVSPPEQDPIPCVVEVIGRDGVPPRTDGHDRGFVE